MDVTRSSVFLQPIQRCCLARGCGSRHAVPELQVLASTLILLGILFHCLHCINSLSPLLPAPFCCICEACAPGECICSLRTKAFLLLLFLLLQLRMSRAYLSRFPCLLMNVLLSFLMARPVPRSQPFRPSLIMVYLWLNPSFASFGGDAPVNNYKRM